MWLHRLQPTGRLLEATAHGILHVLVGKHLRPFGLCALQGKTSRVFVLLALQGRALKGLYIISADGMLDPPGSPAQVYCLTYPPDSRCFLGDDQLQGSLPCRIYAPSPSLFYRMFPFHFVMDRDCRLLQVNLLQVHGVALPLKVALDAGHYLQSQRSRIFCR